MTYPAWTPPLSAAAAPPPTPSSGSTWLSSPATPSSPSPTSTSSPAPRRPTSSPTSPSSASLPRSPAPSGPPAWPPASSSTYPAPPAEARRRSSSSWRRNSVRWPSAPRCAGGCWAALVMRNWGAEAVRPDDGGAVPTGGRRADGAERRGREVEEQCERGHGTGDGEGIGDGGGAQDEGQAGAGEVWGQVRGQGAAFV
ncbi:Polyprenyl synthetase [Musa troglodytarum]|uniref:Polyprenyl synthetase n=1 Tax=Musa troglodytarum TaxID=320322 RepID=A0A9E7ETW2_9LILI|nr:Polyprenyl synthetase [Musa troglodytarum]